MYSARATVGQLITKMCERERRRTLMIRVLDGLLEVALTALKRKPSKNTDKRTERVGTSERRTMMRWESERMCGYATLNRLSDRRRNCRIILSPNMSTNSAPEPPQDASLRPSPVLTTISLPLSPSLLVGPSSIEAPGPGDKMVSEGKRKQEDGDDDTVDTSSKKKVKLEAPEVEELVWPRLKGTVTSGDKLANVCMPCPSYTLRHHC